MTDADTAERTTTDADGPKTGDLEDRLVVEGEIAGDYLEELLDLLDFDGDIDLDVEGDRAVARSSRPWVSGSPDACSRVARARNSNR